MTMSPVERVWQAISFFPSGGVGDGVIVLLLEVCLVMLTLLLLLSFVTSVVLDRFELFIEKVGQFKQSRD